MSIGTRTVFHGEAHWLWTLSPPVFTPCSQIVYFGAVIHCVKGLSTLNLLKTLLKGWKTHPFFLLKMWKTLWKSHGKRILLPEFSTRAR